MNWQVPRAIVLPPTPPAAWTALLHGVGIDYFGDSARWSSSLPPNCSGRTLRNAAPGTGHDARKNSQKPQFPHSVAASPLPRGAYGPQGSTCPPANRRACPYAPPPRSSPAISRPVAHVSSASRPWVESSASRLGAGSDLVADLCGVHRLETFALPGLSECDDEGHDAKDAHDEEERADNKPAVGLDGARRQHHR